MKFLYTAILICCCSFASAQRFVEPSFIKSVFFGGGSAYVSFEQYDIVHSFLDSIPNLHNYIITIHSHTDNVGGKEYNERLSQARSEAVIKVLLGNKAIKREVIEIKDFGLFSPTYDNSTSYGRRMNRRVDIILWLAI